MNATKMKMSEQVNKLLARLVDIGKKSGGQTYLMLVAEESTGDYITGFVGISGADPKQQANLGKLLELGFKPIGYVYGVVEKEGPVALPLAESADGDDDDEQFPELYCSCTHGYNTKNLLRLLGGIQAEFINASPAL